MLRRIHLMFPTCFEPGAQALTILNVYRDSVPRVDSGEREDLPARC